MKKILLFSLSLLMLACNSNQAEKATTEPQKDSIIEDLDTLKSKKDLKESSFLNIKSVEYKMTVSEPSDGEMDDELNGEGSEMIKKTVIEKIKDNKIFWCYDCCELQEIIFTGTAKNLEFYFNGKPIKNEISFDKSYKLKATDFMGGTLEVKGKNGETLHEIQIDYEGCY